MTPLSPKSRAELLELLDGWEASCPDAGRAAAFLRRAPPGRPKVFRDRAKAIEAYMLERRTGMTRWSACMRVASTVAGFKTETKPESIARRLAIALAALEADPAGRKELEEIVLSIQRRK